MVTGGGLGNPAIKVDWPFPRLVPDFFFLLPVLGEVGGSPTPDAAKTLDCPGVCLLAAL